MTHAAAAEKISTLRALVTRPKHIENSTVNSAMTPNRIDILWTVLRTRIDSSGNKDERLSTITEETLEIFLWP